MNALAETRLVDSFNNRLGVALLSLKCKSGEIPEFKCDVGTIYNKKTPTKVYRPLTNSKSNVKVLQQLLNTIWPSPMNDVSFIPYSIWEVLSEDKKRVYRDMQESFTGNTRVITLPGIQNSLLKINTSMPSTVDPNPAHMMISYWISTRKATDMTNLCFKVSNSTNGVMELWLHKWHFIEAKAWATTALQKLAQLSGIDPMVEKYLAEEMFQTPGRVWGK